ncbi:MAG: glycosyltransferase [Nitrososphaerales archaeon]
MDRQVPIKKRVKELSIAIVSTYLPTQCGIAKFTYSLQNSLLSLGDSINIHVMRIVIPDDKRIRSINIHPIKKHDRESYLKAAEFINNSNIDVVNVQHEFGIFGGGWGRYVLNFMVNVKKPIVTVLHTLEPNQGGERAEVFREICKLSEKVIVMIPLSGRAMEQNFDLEDNDKVIYIPHGVPSIEGISKENAKKRLGLHGKHVMISFGLISYGKGFEYAIDALPDVIKRHRDFAYLIIGQTHPNVKKVQGDRYLNMLKQKVHELGLKQHVKFIEKFFVSEKEFSRYLLAGDIFIAPYRSKHQISSGALVYAMAHKMTVVTTPFTHARREVTGKVGYLVKYQNSSSITEAVNALLDNPSKMKKMQEYAYRSMRERTWPHIAKKYLQIFREVASQYN